MPKLPIVPKVWGSETWIVNEPEYCAKMLEIKKGAKGSLHYHPVKKETFIMATGEIKLEVGNHEFTLNAGSAPVTLLPGTHHRFTGITDASILEISTHHDDSDVVRLEISQGVE